MTYNLCIYQCPAIKVSVRRRVQGIVNEISSQQPDVVALQEAGSRSTPRFRRIARQLKAAGYAPARGSGGTYLFYRSDTTSVVSVNNRRLWGARVQTRQVHGASARVVAFQEFEQTATGATFVVAGYHLSAFDTARRDRARAAQYREAERTLVAWRRAHPATPIIKVGDFNSLIQPPSGKYDSDAHRGRVWSLLQRDGFADAATTARRTTNRRKNTINQKSSDRRRFGPARHLDHVFVQSGTTVSAWGILSRPVPYRKQFSDHKPVWALVELPVVERR